MAAQRRTCPDQGLSGAGRAHSHSREVNGEGRWAVMSQGPWLYLACAQKQGAEVNTIQGDIGQWGPGQGCQCGQEVQGAGQLMGHA